MFCQPCEEPSYQPAVLPLPQLELVERFGVSFLTDTALFDASGTRIAFTRRTFSRVEGGQAPLDVGRGPRPRDERVAESRSLVMRAIGTSPRAFPLAMPNQVHGDVVVAIGGSPAHGPSPGRRPAVPPELESGCDGMVCSACDQPVGLSFADCTPVVIVAPGGAFAIAHAGWRGALAGIGGKATAMLAQVTGLSPSGFSAYVGPHICASCYGVSSELLSRFVARFGPDCAQGCDLSLSVAVQTDLIETGIAPERIVDAVLDEHLDACTRHHCDHYFSYRAQGERAGRQGAFACRRELAP